MTENIPTQPATEPQTVSVGAQLKAAREVAGFTQAQIAEKLKLAPRQVAALEADDFSGLPGNTFVRGFVRNYARLLQLDSQSLLAQLAMLLPEERVQIAMPPVSDASAYAGRIGSGPVRWAWLVWVFVVMGILLGAGGVFWYLQKPAAPDVTLAESGRFQDGLASGASIPVAVASPVAVEISSPASAPVAVPTPALVAVPASAPVETGIASSPVNVAPASESGEGSPIRIVTAGAGSWVRVTDADDRVLISQLVAAHGERTAAGRPPYRLKIGNAPKVQLYYRGAAVDLAPYIRGDVATFELK